MNAQAPDPALDPAPDPAPAPAPGMHLPCLLVALAIMLAGTLYPPMFAGADGRADHGLAMALFWAMSAGFVRGIGFVPASRAWRWLLSGPAVAAGLGIAAWLRLG